MALRAARPVFCQLKAEKPAVPEFQKLKVAEVQPDSSGKIVLQPRVCTLRSYGGDRGGVIKASNSEDEVSRFFEVLSDYVESSKKSHDFEIITGRLAMIVFAATVGMEVVTGNSVFRKMDLQGIEEAAGVCLAAITSAAVFAWFSSNRNRVGRIFTTSCNTFIDSLIDKIVDGLFYEIDINDWSDEI
ncbi:UNVERIFIED_CONTAM: Stress enhanced protein 2, chloroplastic [Sesamum calycinum]|uniref:Stress enhanced protein 2, chloroplastic n=2 Tax=Sesamum TaxID=4181 RepID=A0AAW2KZA2_9LAMI